MTDPESYATNGPRTTGSFDSLTVAEFEKIRVPGKLTCFQLRSRLTSPRKYPTQASPDTTDQRRDPYVENPFLAYPLGRLCCCCVSVHSLVQRPRHLA